jgi:hypothetical protein
MSAKDGKEALGPSPAVFFCDTAEVAQHAHKLGYRAWSLERG